MPVEELRKEGLGEHYTEYDRALFYTDTTRIIWTAAYIQTKGNVVADLHEYGSRRKAKSNI